MPLLKSWLWQMHFQTVWFKEHWYDWKGRYKYDDHKPTWFRIHSKLKCNVTRHLVQTYKEHGAQLNRETEKYQQLFKNLLKFSNHSKAKLTKLEQRIKCLITFSKSTLETCRLHKHSIQHSSIVRSSLPATEKRFISVFDG